MGYRTESGRYADTLPVAFLGAGGHEKGVAQSPGTISATGSSPVVELGDRGSIRLTALISAVAGSSPTLDITVMTCDTRAGTFRSIGTFTQITGTGTSKKSFGGCDRFVRLDYVIGGTGGPSLTGSIDGDAC